MEDTIFGIHDGNIQVWSLDYVYENGTTFIDVVDHLYYKNRTHEIPNIDKIFFKLIKYIEDDLFTERQKFYINMSDEERNTMFTKQARYDYRKTLKNKIFKYLFNNSVNEYFRRLDYILNAVRVYLKFLYHIDDEAKYLQLIKDFKDNDYFEYMLYDLLPPEFTKKILQGDTNNFTRYTLLEYMEDDIKNLLKTYKIELTNFCVEALLNM